jgi:Fe-S cluster assembly protein SufD
MEFKEKLISSHLAFEEDLYQNDRVAQARASALKVFEEKGFPSKKEEAWKYTSLEALIQKDYALFPKSESSIELNEVKKILFIRYRYL